MDQLNYRLPKRKDGLKTFNKIISTGKKLFSKQGYQATSINEIIEKSKIATGTFYIYFDDKLALYVYLLQHYRNKIREAINDSIKGAQTRREKERLGIRAFLKFAWQDPLSYRIIWESMFVDESLFKEYYENFAKAYTVNLEDGIKSNEVDENIDTETLSYILMGISNFVGLQVLFRDTLTDMDLDKIVDQVMYVLDHGMFKNA
ncbi:AcrR family transcriptional regulator [Acholeplasma morum]|uniref:TetR/AcrR family transcriptional regulator n=1 Tax=Paracholeplasma morum TaxID=264637 RepID=UPI001956B28F|nr:TetR/AcrR family transcriptional regulator [Paracholeplasma morum]MBM7454043.1 AcrR family transcriptional regulator [Paracholeplasma morum]